jgi:16S rRNA (cytidine1402-2'-O)-methyltransferase
LGTLFLVSTPVGNLGDITYRAIETLKEAKYILAEDTRVTGKLLKHYEVGTPMRSYHDHNKEKVTAGYIEILKGSDDNLALVTDAGTPGIADPAFYIVRECIKNGIKINAIPGATAFVPAIITSGLPSDRFIFENFLAPKASKRKAFFETMRDEKRTVIFYETPHRLLKVLKELDEVLGDIPVVIAREITKLFEENLRGTPKSLLNHYSERKPKGEMVLLFSTSVSLEQLSW